MTTSQATMEAGPASHRGAQPDKDLALAAQRALMSRAARANPYPYYAVLREHGPVKDPDTGVAMIATFDACDRILRDPVFRVEDRLWISQFFPDRLERPSTQIIVDSMIATNPPRHERMRRLVSWAFTPRRVAAMHESVRRRIAELVDRLAELGSGGQPVDFVAEFAYRVPVNVVGDILGIPEVDRPWFAPLAYDLDATLELHQSPHELERADRAARELLQYIAELVASRRRDPGDDLVSGLIEATKGIGPDGDRLTEDELLANIALVLVNGFATTNDLLTNGLAALLERPDHLQRLRANPDLAPAYVEEMLRFDAPVQLTLRWAGEETEICGIRLNRYDPVIVLIGSANRDAARFINPDEFDPDRPNNGSLSFGAGPHFCFGAPLARMEARLAFPMLLTRCPKIAPAERPRRRNRLTLRGFESYPITVG